MSINTPKNIYKAPRKRKMSERGVVYIGEVQKADWSVIEAQARKQGRVNLLKHIAMLALLTVMVMIATLSAVVIKGLV